MCTPISWSVKKGPKKVPGSEVGGGGFKNPPTRRSLRCSHMWDGLRLYRKGKNGGMRWRRLLKRKRTQGRREGAYRCDPAPPQAVYQRDVVVEDACANNEPLEPSQNGGVGVLPSSSLEKRTPRERNDCVRRQTLLAVVIPPLPATLATLHGADKEGDCASTTVHSPRRKQEVDTPIAPSEKDTDVDIPPLQHAFCRSELGGRDRIALGEPEQSAAVGDVPPDSPGQGPRGIDSTQGQTYLEVVIPQLPPKTKKRHVSDSTANSAGKSAECTDIEAPDVRPLVNGVRRQANITIEIPPLPVDWWAWKEIHSPIKFGKLGPSSAYPRTPRPQPKEHQPKKRPRGRPRRVLQTPRPPKQRTTTERSKPREHDQSPNTPQQRALRTLKRKSPSKDNISEEVAVEHVSSSISTVHVSPVPLSKKVRLMSPTISPSLLSIVDPTGRLAEEHSDSPFLLGAADPMKADLGDVEPAWYSNDILREPRLQLENDWSVGWSSTSSTRDDRLFSQFIRARSPQLSPSCVSRAYSVETTAAEGVPNLRLPPEDVDDEPDIDMLFDQYLHSSPPSPSLSPKYTPNEFSGVTLIDVERDQYRSSGDSCPQTFKPSALEGMSDRDQAGDQAEDPRCLSNGPRNRPRPSQPKITLRIKLQGTGPDRKKKKERKEKKQKKQKKQTRRR
jgi:hypothetical protein